MASDETAAESPGGRWIGVAGCYFELFNPNRLMSALMAPISADASRSTPTPFDRR
jgi:hypothetical protein